MIASLLLLINFVFVMEKGIYAFDSQLYSVAFDMLYDLATVSASTPLSNSLTAFTLSLSE